MDWIKVEDGNAVKYPYLYSDLKKDNPNTSFPKGIINDPATLAEYGVFNVTLTSPPSYEVATQKVASRPMPELVNGTWMIVWDITALTQEEQEAALSKKRSLMIVTPRQAKQALRQSGLYNQVKQYINTLQGDAKDEAEIEWNDATEFQRASGFLISMATALGLTEQQVDDLFDLAATL